MKDRIAYREAARRLDVSESVIRGLLRRGVLRQTPPPTDGSGRTRAHASIDPDSLDRARAWLDDRQAERERRRRRREAHGNPPDLDHVWLTPRPSP